ncbi:hypothetical protein GOP47_0020916 [Adiantum capillus-veneris]|uniref:Uncharacterized protein n=1 Tax=Adiantum capillus-veneris TaxID=13818 RepID=A0A9D4UBY7_ADICA|nr:hypothetical protein GOP47_0020916 [Adiantum capillus-veneris]
MARSALYILKGRSWVLKTACSKPCAASAMYKGRSMSSLHLVEESNPQMHVELRPDLDGSLLEDSSGARRLVPTDQDVMSRQKFGQTALTVFKWAATQSGLNLLSTHLTRC